MDANDLAKLPWLTDVTDQVNEALQKLVGSQPDVKASLEHELSELDTQIKGWTTSLSNPKLPVALRNTIEEQCGIALEQQTTLRERLSQQEFREVKAANLVKPDEVLERIQRLGDVLGNGDPTRCNLELSLHIDRIKCFPDGKVIMRTCKLGMLTDARELLAMDPPSNKRALKPVTGKGVPRRRARLRITTDEGEQDIRSLTDFAADHDRFAGLGDEWFWVHEFQAPNGQASWTRDNAETIFCCRQEMKMSLGDLAKKFGVTRPTIKAAILCYEETHPGEKDGVKLQCGGKRPPSSILPNMVRKREHFGKLGHRSWNLPRSTTARHRRSTNS